MAQSWKIDGIIKIGRIFRRKINILLLVYYDNIELFTL